MKIRFRQSGGFAGLHLGCDLDTEEMPAREARTLTRLVEGSKFIRSQSFKSDRGRDLGLYEIVLEQGGKKVTITFDDMSIPPEAGKILEFLRSRSHRQP